MTTRTRRKRGITLTRTQLLEDPDRMLEPREVAYLYQVNPKTVTRWHAKGKLTDVHVIKTPGGHRRFRAGDIKALLESEMMDMGGMAGDGIK
jgi:DNA-binding transcriptional MerR regulator